MTIQKTHSLETVGGVSLASDRTAADGADMRRMQESVDGLSLDLLDALTLLAQDRVRGGGLRLVGEDGLLPAITQHGAHLDLSTEDVPTLVDRAVRLGAEIVTPHGGWVVLRSPTGQLFCAVPWHGESTRPPVVDGNRLDQVCLDVARAGFDAEIAFWATLTGWDSPAGSRPEFHVLRPPTDLPLRLRLQRLDTPRPTSAHLDLACTDIPTTRAHHEHLGATVVADHPHWTVMRDPAGGTYCLTGRDPGTGGLPRVG